MSPSAGCCASGSATRWSTGWWSRCWAGSTPAGPTSCRWRPRCPRWPRTCRRPGRSWAPRPPPGTPVPAAAGSGLLVPPVTGRLVKGVTVSSAKWPHLGEGLLVRSSVGRFRDESELQRDDADLVAAVVADVADLLQLERPRPVQTALRRWG